MHESAAIAVFLSYAREDASAARRIADALRSQGLEVWFDESELRGGDAWDQKIRRQIRECALFIPVISACTQARGEGYFRLEWKLAVERTHLMAEGVPFLAPVVVDETSDANAAVPAEFLRVQWTRLPAGLPTPQFVEQVKRLLREPRRPAGASRGGAGGPVAGDRSRPVRPPRLVAGGAILLLALGAFLVWRRAGPTASRGAAPPAEKSIAVLPLANMSDDKGNGFFADGVHDELITDLAAIADLKVISRTSVLQYRDARVNLREIGRELGVTYIMEGSVRREGNRVRVTAQLIDTRSDTHVWAGTFEKEISDVFVLQATLAQEIATALQTRLTPEETRRIERPRGASPEVYELAQRARTILFGTDSTRENYANATALAKQAVEREPGFAFGWATVGHVDVAWGYRGFDRSAQRAAEAKAAIDRALQLDPDLPEAHWALGRYIETRVTGANMAEVGHSARNELERARKSMPNEPRILADIASVVFYVDGDAAAAVALQRRGVELNPKDPLAHYNLGRMLYNLSRYDEALGNFETAQRLNPVFVGNVCYLADTLIRLRGDLEGAENAVNSLPATVQDDRAVYYRYLMARYRRQPQQALLILRESPIAYFHDNIFSGPREFLEGQALATAGDRAGAMEKFRAARDREAPEAREGNADERDSALRIQALIAASLGDEPNALAFLRKYETTSLDLPARNSSIADLRAHVAVSLGREDQAMDALEDMVHKFGTESPSSLRLEPDWDPLRSNPRFQKLVQTEQARR